MPHGLLVMEARGKPGKINFGSLERVITTTKKVALLHILDTLFESFPSL